MIVYLDVLFFINTAVNILLLLSACRFAGKRPKPARLIAAGALGGAYAVLTALPELQSLSGWAGRMACVLSMLLIAFGWGIQTVRLGVWFLLLSVAFAGVVLLLTGVFGVGVYMVGGTAVYPISAPTLVLLSGVSYLAVSLLLRGFSRQSMAAALKSVTICCRGRKHRYTALLDTGNTLRDPMTGKPVFVLDSGCANELLPELRSQDMARPAEAFSALAKTLPGLRLLPYRAVGVEGGLLLGIRCDWVMLGKEKITGATVAFSPSPVSRGNYQVIAGGS